MALFRFRTATAHGRAFATPSRGGRQALTASHGRWHRCRRLNATRRWTLVPSSGLFFLHDAASPVGASLCPSAPYQKDRLKLCTRVRFNQTASQSSWNTAWSSNAAFPSGISASLRIPSAVVSIVMAPRALTPGFRRPLCCSGMASITDRARFACSRTRCSFA